MTCVVIATGPSLTRADVEYCRGRAEVGAVSDAIRWAPWADWMYSADYRWFKANAHAVRSFQGKRYTVDNGADSDFDCERLDHRIDPGGDWLSGGNSGQQGAEVATIIRGHRRVILLGFDMGATGPSHFFGDHPDVDIVDCVGKPIRVRMQTTTPQDFERWISDFSRLAGILARRGVEVLNATRVSALECFPKVTLEEALL